MLEPHGMSFKSGKNNDGLRIIVWPEHERMIRVAGYTTTKDQIGNLVFDKPVPILISSPPMRKRIIAEVQTVTGEWIKLGRPMEIRDNTPLYKSDRNQTGGRVYIITNQSKAVPV